MRSGLQGGILLIIITVALRHCTLPGPQRRGHSTLLPPGDRERWHQRVASRKAGPPLADLTITFPYDGTVFPPEIAAPTFRWIDHHPDSTHWLAVLRFSDKAKPVYALTDRPQWQPEPATWAAIKARSVDAPAEVVIFGVRMTPVKMLTAEGRIAITASRDRVDASILYRQVPLRFSSKANAIQTEIFLTHIDETGMDSPPVYLSRFSDSRLAANVPEFVNLPPDAIRTIVPDDH